MNALASEAARGDRVARRELQQLRRQEREQQRAVVGQQRQQPQQAAMPQPANDRAERQRPQGERVGLRQQQQGPPVRPNVERRQGPPQKAAGPPQSKGQGGGGGDKGKGKGRP
jgi:hypothetical protein